MINKKILAIIFCATVLSCVLYDAVSEAQVGIFSKEDIIYYTPLWKGERFPDGRPKVSDEILKRMKDVAIEEA